MIAARGASQRHDAWRALGARCELDARCEDRAQRLQMTQQDALEQTRLALRGLSALGVVQVERGSAPHGGLGEARAARHAPCAPLLQPLRTPPRARGCYR